MNLPDEIVLYLFSQPCLTTKDKLVFLDVCQQWKRIVGDRSLWETCYLHAHEASALLPVLPTNMPLRLLVRYETKCPRRILQRLFLRASHVKWLTRSSIRLGINPCPLLTHLQVAECLSSEIASLLPWIKDTLRVLFLENVHGTFVDIRRVHDVLAQCMSLTHLHLTLSDIDAPMPLPCSPNLVYFESHSGYDLQMSPYTEHKFNLMRYLYLRVPMALKYMHNWRKIAKKTTSFKAFDVFFREGLLVRFAFSRWQDLTHDMATYPDAQCHKIGPVYRCSLNARTFSFDTIDEAK